ncbi:MAG: tetratricopeptide repeat protein [Bacteroidales bacterium]|nr:tetratricopeptide repeat protein [Bacteroidales bacterium]
MKLIFIRIITCYALVFLTGLAPVNGTIDFDDFKTEPLQDTGKLKTLYDSARFYSRIDPVLSKNLLRKLIAISKSKDSSELYDYYTLFGNACVVNGEFDEAQYYYGKSLAIDKERKDTLEQIRVYNNLNYLYLLSGKLDLSLQSAHEGARLIEIMKQGGSLPSSMKQFGDKKSDWVEAYFYTNIGQINMKVGNYKEALYYYQRALSSVETSGDKIYYASALNDMALAYRQLKQYDQALACIQKALTINKEIDNEFGVGLNYQILGDIYAQTEDLTSARTLLDEGMEILEKSDDINAQSLTLLSIVDVEIKSKQFDKARKNLDKCFDLVKMSNDLRTLKDYYYYKFKLDSFQNKNQEAMASYIRYHELDKQIIDVQLSQRIADIQTTYEMQRKEQENKLLKSENEVQKIRINKSRTILIALCGIFGLIFVITLLVVRHQRLLTQHKIIELKQKNLNQQMNPHFVYNCLTSIQSYIFHNDTPKSLEYLSKFSKLMRKILESSQNQYMSVQDEIEMLSLYLKLESVRFKGKFDYDIFVDEKIDPILFKIPSLLIQPFVENSLWHGIQNKQGKGRIQVSFNLADKSIFCAIEDNGIGRENAEKIKNSRITNHISLGGSITQTRMKLLKSLYGSRLGIRYIDLKDNENKPSGTRVELFLPILN